MKEILGTVVGESKRRLLIGCLTLLVGVPTMGCCLLVLFTVVLPGLDSSAAGGGSSSMPIWLLVIGLLLLAGLIGVPVGIAVVTILRRARAMDAIFNPLGFTGTKRTCCMGVITRETIKTATQIFISTAAQPWKCGCKVPFKRAC